MSSLIPSSSFYSILRVVASIVYLFFIVLFDASTSASLTISRISHVLKTNFPLIATRFPFLPSSYTLNSSLVLAIFFYKRAFWEEVLAQASFEPETYRNDNKRRLLLLDEHGSHLTARFIAFCLNKNIYLVVLPPHRLLRIFYNLSISAY